MEFYQPEELSVIITKSAERLGVSLTPDASLELAKRSRGTPRVANRMLRRARDFAQVEGDGTITLDLTKFALERLGIDEVGLDSTDRKILHTIADKFDGGPVGLNNLSTALGEESDTISEKYEPFLIMKGFMQRTQQGRVITARGRQHINYKAGQGKLF
tara:strand:- start:28 stop:504 length:477 start_codon:yes stop_codon:yes gene_type:complete